ncbi:MAG: cytochrome b [bacterium]
MSEGILHWINERYRIEKILYFSREKSVPLHKGTIWYYFGGITLFLFGLQVITGLLLLFYYRVGPDASFESIKFIVTKVKFGWLLRSLHSWSANIMILAALIHMISVFFHRSYRKPRELTWVTGVIMLFMLMVFGFSGYLLPWNQLAFFATKVGTESALAIPLIGEFLLKLMRGGAEVTGVTLSRFFGLHVAVLPPLFTLVLSLHLFFVQMQGMSEPIENSNEAKVKRSIPFFPDFFLRDLVVWLIVLNILLALSVFFPWELGEKADPFSPAPPGIKPEWYFLFIFQTLKILPPHIFGLEGEMIGVLGLAIMAIFLILIPWIDTPAREGRRSKLLDVLGILFLIYFAVFTILGYVLS